MKKCLTLLMFALLLMINQTSAAIERGTPVAVMDFGTHPGAVPIDINVLNAGQAANEYVTVRLINTQKLDVMDRAMVENIIAEEGINVTGLIVPSAAKRIGELLNVRYIIYGNVNDVTLSDVGTSILASGVTVCTVKSHIIMRMMDVTTGQIISASKGEGKSKSSFVKLSGGPILTVEVGTKKVTQDSVHNAIEQAAFQAVDILLERLQL